MKLQTVMSNLIQAEIGYIPLERDMNGTITKATGGQSHQNSKNKKRTQI